MLHQIRPASGSRRSSKRIARGNSGKGGTTAGRGTKGQHSRTGKGRKLGFEGGQVPLLMRQPKLGGFARPRRKAFEVVNVETLEERLPAGSYGKEEFKAHRLVRGNGPIKLLARGDVKKKFDLTVDAASSSAKAAIEKAGGKVMIVKK